MTAVRDTVRRALHQLGADIVRYPANAPGYRRVKLLVHHGIDLVLDVGANDGGYGRELREFGYSGRIVSFEPLGDAHSRLLAACSRDPEWVAVRQAVGNRRGTATINVAGNSRSSSVLPMLDAHRRSAPTSGYIGTEEVPMVRLDDEWDRHVPLDFVPFLKVDTQGFERQVLDGAADSMCRFRGVQLEMSLIPLYEGSMLFEEAWGRLDAAGFELQSIEPGFSDQQSGRLLQADGIFFRRLP